MSALRKPEIYFTELEYFQFEKHSSVKHEYYQGQLYAMAGTSPRHNRITISAVRALANQLSGRPCEPFGMDQRLRVETADLNTYPDVLVACPPLNYSANDPYALLDATVIIEVISPSTANYDKGTKFDFYCELPGLRHYVLIEQDRMEVEHRWLDSQTGDWQREVLTEAQGVVPLSAIECSLSVADLYERIDFENLAS